MQNLSEKTELKPQNPVIDWIIRMVKGVIIGIGFILPGLSGGVLAVIFGLYDKILKFLANIKEDFIKNVLFFIPVGIGMAIGIFLFSVVVEKAFGKYAAIFICLFVGFVIGTFPSLYRTAGKQGRKTKDILIMLISALVLFGLMMLGEKQLMDVAPGILSWLGSGALISLGLIVPGMSPSNFLIYFGLYDKMASGIKDLLGYVPFYTWHGYWLIGSHFSGYRFSGIKARSVECGRIEYRRSGTSLYCHADSRHCCLVSFQ